MNCFSTCCSHYWRGLSKIGQIELIKTILQRWCNVLVLNYLTWKACQASWPTWERIARNELGWRTCLKPPTGGLISKPKSTWPEMTVSWPNSEITTGACTNRVSHGWSRLAMAVCWASSSLVTNNVAAVRKARSFHSYFKRICIKFESHQLMTPRQYQQIIRG